MTTDTANQEDIEPNVKKKSGVAIFLERPSLVMFGLGFAAGMPNQLAGAALAIWLREAGASLALIGLLGLVTLTYSLKFLWAPVVDRVAIPVLDKVLGRRRSWMFVTQGAVMAGLLLLATRDPSGAFTPEGDATAALMPFAFIAFLIAFAGATQDIAIDAWRIEVSTDEDRLAVITATYQWGYRIAILLAGALPLFVAQAFNGDKYQWLGWGIAYAAMAGFMIIPIISTFLAPRELAAPAPRWIPPADIKDNVVLETVEWAVRLAIMVLAACFLAAGLAGKHEPVSWLMGGLYGGADAMGVAFKAKPWGVWQQVLYAIGGLGIVVLACSQIPGVRTKPAAYFQAALGEPLGDFFKRYDQVAALILIFICVYRIADFLLNLTSTLYLDAGFGKDEIAFAQKFFGAFMSAVGAGVSGWLVIRVGLFRCLIIGSFLQPISNMAFAAITLTGANLPALYLAIGIDNLSAAFAGTCLVVYMSMLTKEGFTATQYALFSSLYSLPGKIISALSGRVVEGAAKAADSGWLAFMRPAFERLPPEAFAAGGAKLGVSGASLAAGYTAFFFYTAIIGVIAIFLALMVSRGPAREILEREESEKAAA